MLEKQRHEISRIKDPEERIAQWQNLLKAETEALGKLHPTVLETRHIIGFEYYKAEQYAKAEEVWEVSLAEFTEVHGPENEGTLRCMNNLAKAQYLRGKMTEAEPLYRKAIEIADRTLPEDNALRRRLHENLDMLLEAKSNTH